MRPAGAAARQARGSAAEGRARARMAAGTVTTRVVAADLTAGGDDSAAGGE